MSKLLRRTLFTLAGAVILYAVAVVWMDVTPVLDTLRGYNWAVFAGALALSAGNYLLRFAKWELSLGWLQVRKEAPELTRPRSLLIYLAGLSMSITPGKVGELLRSMLLRASDGVAFTRTAPIVVADRITDLVALVLLSLLGLADNPDFLPYVLIAVVLVIAGVGVLGSPRLCHGLLNALARLPRAARLVERARPMVDSSAPLLRLGPVLVLSLLSVVGWGLECVGFWLVLGGFGLAPSLTLCAFLWAIGTLVGALSLLPGGLVATEASLVLTTARLVPGTSHPVAVAAALLGRLATLWFGELVGAVALALFLRHPNLRAKAMESAPAVEAGVS